MSSLVCVLILLLSGHVMQLENRDFRRHLCLTTKMLFGDRLVRTARRYDPGRGNIGREIGPFRR
jgi:hypothetical protein